MESRTAADHVLIIGAGQAGVQVADSLRTAGHTGAITLLNDEDAVPYQRPPLSKDYLCADSLAAPLPLRGPEFFTQHDITVLPSAATAVDTAARKVTLTDGTIVEYTHLVFATGAANRALPCPGADLEGVHGLRTLWDAENLQQALSTAQRVVVIGAGFIGLEFAAAARARGLQVTVLEFASRPMGRALSATAADWFTTKHTQDGITLRLNEGVAAIRSAGLGLRVQSTTGAHYDADLVLYGVGVLPRTALAQAAGLRVDNGIVVDSSLRTTVDGVFAVGDCASFPHPNTGARTRIESVQNATDHGRHVARMITGESGSYSETPWFWSMQGPTRLQIAGISSPADEPVVLGNPDSGKFSIALLRDGVLSAVESVNSAADHIAARRLVGQGIKLTPQELCAPGFSLKALAKAEVSLPA
ncbi:pyridine nucleotide-disulfide oxidoreductase [Arthrobacter sp. MYb227]|uniref:NAD(P)/FAD-dependent oxidoreductase n=1 Tax=Arthrobacter sp. MYb227 TaxID=1848601 RepID=UPI000CFAD116|nr:FAD-dependent oxidoreductase [Arthrobacter sp. MYb227]PQZ95149.1 pyridine nucleotide-disulfide oxidoreductase [Arthrobacter sp. MYb227]